MYAKIAKLITISFFAAALGASTALAVGVQAKKKGVKVFAEPSKKASVIAKLKKGEVLESIERKGMYWHVKLDGGKTGYVSVLKVRRKAGAATGLAKAIRDVVKKGRSTDDVADSRSRSAVMGVRGLAEDDNVDAAGNVRPNMRAVYAMEDLSVSETEMESLGDTVFSEIEKKSENL